MHHSTFADPEIYDFLEAEGIGYTIQLLANSTLQEGRPGAYSPSTTGAARQSSGSKEGKNAIEWAGLSCRTFAAHLVRLQLHAIAYDRGNFHADAGMLKAADDGTGRAHGRS
jgi:hypothetical protein